MCELFGVCAEHPIMANDLLRNFYLHSENNRDGWGLAVFRGTNVSIEKEPLMASSSGYLRHRLATPIVAGTLIAHIREASVGRIEHANCHPFSGEDTAGVTWILAHNGTLFEAGKTGTYIDEQIGTTDSERILLDLLHALKEKGVTGENHAAVPAERFLIVAETIAGLAKGNKLNLLICDGTYMYAHTNQQGRLYVRDAGGIALFATKPVLFAGWEQLPPNVVHVYRGGREVWQSEPHEHTYFEESHDMTPLFGAYAEL